MRSRVVVAMSGGVDSSVAAALLLAAGHDCVGVFMRHASPVLPAEAAGPLSILPERPGHQGCCSPADALDARRVADRLGMPLYALDLTPEFDRLIDAFAADYGAGRTPNPCVRCNSWIKFGRLFEHADAIGATHVATGHYARLEQEAAGPVLRRGLDHDRDQSYVLFDIATDRLRRMLLPVGGLAKREVRERAAALGLATASKPDSQEICFVAPGEHARLVAHRLGGSRAGEIVDSTGRVLGRHPGIEHFTVGQRQGLGIAVGTPLHVIRIEPDTCRVVVGGRAEVPEHELVAAEARWLGEPPEGPFPCLVQCRAQRTAAPAMVTPLPGGRFMARFTGGPERSPGPISPGQPAVCYEGDRLLGGGWIVG
ncbi:MAG: tRNA 2-thiouridine(34) synthase MnmA [Pirellulales bacterium]